MVHSVAASTIVLFLSRVILAGGLLALAAAATRRR
jgi:hypothetical protein